VTSAGNFDDGRAMIEAVHHASLAGDLDGAAAILYNHVYHGPSAHSTRVLGAYELMLDTLNDFFPLGDLSLDPRLKNPGARRWILHETATCLYVLGRLPRAAELLARAAAAAIAAGDRHNAAISYHNLAEAHLAAGALASCRAVSIEALHLAISAEEKEDELVACTLLGRLDDLAARYEDASAAFARAIEIALAHTSVPLLYSLSGVRYADHLIAVGSTEEALSVIGSNLEFCRQQGWQSDAALCLAQLASTSPMPVAESLERADEAVRAARTLGVKQVLAEAMLRRAALMLRTDRYDTARVDLSEVLSHVQSGGFRILEVDARTDLAIARAGLGEPLAASVEAELAVQLSRELEYERGEQRAREILGRIQAS
jgi:tetratricopeptide (TPR) repeat protein